MSRWCFWLAVISPASLALGWFLVAYPPLWTAGNAPALVLMAISLPTLFASAVIGIKQILDSRKSGTGWLAAGLVIDYCWFQILCAVVIIEQVRGR
jgi:hypothetical protein